MSAPFKKNDDITLEITGLTSEGAGVGRHDGFAVFVPGALPGESVSAHIIKVASSYAVGKLTEVIKKSSDRVTPPCPSYPQCGGCSLQHMSYEAQLEFKRGLVRDALERIGGITGLNVKPTIGMSSPEKYRNKGSFPFGASDGRVIWGLYAARSHRLVEAKNCLIERDEATAAAEAVKEWANRYGVAVYDETNGKGVLRHVVTRVCTGGVSVCVVTTGALPHSDELVKLIRDTVPGVRSIVHNVNPKNTNVICGKEYRLIRGGETVTHEICGLRYSVSAESFLQVNTEQTEKLYRLAVDGLDLKGSETVADVFCGIGTMTLLIAEKARKAVGIEYVERAVSDAHQNAGLNGITNAEFYAGPAEEILPRLVKAGERFDCVVLDPPRKGAEREVLEAVAESGASRIAYVSCDPATLARDLKILCVFGYEIVSVQPVDMFPMTQHVETVCLLRRERCQNSIEFSLDVTKISNKKAGYATYSEIKEFVKDKYGFKVSSLYIAQAKNKLGIIERENYNIGNGKAKPVHCSLEKEEAIIDALRYYGMIE